jgi:monofunctional glycosyltransferase
LAKTSSRLARVFTLRRALQGAVLMAAAGFALIAYVYVTLPDVRELATTNPETTAWMELRTREAASEGKTIRHVRRWVPYSRISASLKRAVLVAEDSAFWDHEGVDYVQLRDAIQVSWEQGRAVRGASTITQQLAKNLYLSPARDPIGGPLRKLKELIIARRMEAALPKARIFEIYLNSIEWGDGIWGAEAAARTYFGIPASQLNARQSALLAGAIINPRVLNPARPTARLLSRQRIVLSRMGEVTPPTAVPVVVEAAPETLDTIPEAMLPSGDEVVAPPPEEPVPSAAPDELLAPQPFPPDTSAPAPTEAAPPAEPSAQP